MSENFYQEIDQRIFLVNEQSYGYPYDPQTDRAAWTKLGATFPHVIPINIIADSFDYDIPKIIKEKIYAIGGGKHPTVIANTKQEPVEITFETKMQYAIFKAYAIGSVASTGTRPEVTVITFATVTDSSAQGKYFLVNGIDASGEEHFAVWLDTAGDGSTGKPAVEGIAADHVLAANVSGAVDPTNPTAAEISAAVHAIMNADAAFGTVDGTGSVTVTNALDGAVRDARDSGADPMGISVSITQQGVNTHTVTENVTANLPSFTIHIEQQNRGDSGEDIVIDLFGCVIDSYEVSVDYGEGTVTESVTFRCPHYAVGTKLTNPPPFADTLEPHTWANLKESASNNIFMEGIIDKTPTSVNSVRFTVGNNVDFQPDIGVRYNRYHIAKKREVSLNIVGFSENRDSLDYYLDEWDNVNQRYSSASGRLNSKLKLQRDATYDYSDLSVYNWLLEEHNHNIVSIDDGIKGIDITLTDATPDSNRRIIDSFSIVDYLSDTCYQNSFS